jgi:hypothetical protein
MPVKFVFDYNLQTEADLGISLKISDIQPVMCWLLKALPSVHTDSTILLFTPLVWTMYEFPHFAKFQSKVTVFAPGAAN